MPRCTFEETFSFEGQTDDTDSVPRLQPRPHSGRRAWLLPETLWNAKPRPTGGDGHRSTALASI